MSVVAFDGQRYQARFDALAARGDDIHGEARFIRALQPRSVLDAGCGTGRVAIELARHSIDVVGVDVEASMIAEARRRAPTMAWVEADLVDMNLFRTFDVVVLAGNVPLFTRTATEAALVSSCAAHVEGGGALVAGFSLDRGYGLDDYDASCAAAGFGLSERWATWGRAPFVTGGDYAVSVHRRLDSSEGQPPRTRRRSVPPGRLDGLGEQARLRTAGAGLGDTMPGRQWLRVAHRRGPRHSLSKGRR